MLSVTCGAAQVSPWGQRPARGVQEFARSSPPGSELLLLSPRGILAERQFVVQWLSTLDGMRAQGPDCCPDNKLWSMWEWFWFFYEQIRQKKEKAWLRDWRSSHDPHISTVAAAVTRCNARPGSILRRGRTLWRKGSDCSKIFQNNTLWHRELWAKEGATQMHVHHWIPNAALRMETWNMNYAW